MMYSLTRPKELSNFITQVQIQDHSVVAHLMPYQDQLLDYLYNSKTIFTFSCLLSSSLTHGNANWFGKREKKKMSVRKI